MQRRRPCSEFMSLRTHTSPCGKVIYCWPEWPAANSSVWGTHWNAEGAQLLYNPSKPCGGSYNPGAPMWSAIIHAIIPIHCINLLVHFRQCFIAQLCVLVLEGQALMTLAVQGVVHQRAVQRCTLAQYSEMINSSKFWSAFEARVWIWV